MMLSASPLPLPTVVRRRLQSQLLELLSVASPFDLRAQPPPSSSTRADLLQSAVGINQLGRQLQTLPCVHAAYARVGVVDVGGLRLVLASKLMPARGEALIEQSLRD